MSATAHDHRTCGIGLQCYAGLEVQETEVRDDKINISSAVEQFREDVETRSSFLPRSHGYSQRMPDGCDLDVYSVPYKKLPDAVFESFGGKKTANEIRKARRAAKGPKAKKKGKKGEAEITPQGEQDAAPPAEEQGPPSKKTKSMDGSAVPDVLAEDEGRTALHTAAMIGNMEQIQALLKDSPAQLNAVDGGGKTPLDLAILHSKLDVVDYLREAGGLAPMEAARVARFNIDEDARKSKLTRTLSIKEAEYDFVGDEEAKEDDGERPEGEGEVVAQEPTEGEDGVVEVEGVVRTHEDLIHFAPFVPKWRRPSRLPRNRPIKTPVHFTWAAGV